MKNILIANDDGIEAQGIHELANALKGHANVYICAPDSQRSASGHGITVSGPMEAEEVEFEGAELAIKLSGMPADCVKLGLRIMKQKGIDIDMVFSGINHGGNLGTDTLYSGTVAAAIEGTICGRPSIAVSVNSHTPHHFGYACSLAVKFFEASKDRLGPDTVLNINVPDLPEEEVKGLKYTTLGKREYQETFEPVEGENGKTLYSYTGIPVYYEGLPDTIDVIAMQKGYATVTPLQRDLTDRLVLEDIKEWRIDG